MTTYRVLRGIYERTGEVAYSEGKSVHYERVRWVDVGEADSVEDAKSRYPAVLYGYALVMQATPSV